MARSSSGQPRTAFYLDLTVETSPKLVSPNAHSRPGFHPTNGTGPSVQRYKSQVDRGEGPSNLSEHPPSHEDARVRPSAKALGKRRRRDSEDIRGGRDLAVVVTQSNLSPARTRPGAMSSAGQGGVHGRRASQSLMPSAMPPPPLPSTLLSTQSSKHVPSARASPAPSLASTSASRRQREYSFVVEVPMRRSRPTGNAKRAIASTSDTSRASVTPAQAVRPVDPSVARYPASTHPGSAVRARRSISSSLQISADASLHTRSPATATSSGHSRRNDAAISPGSIMGSDGSTYRLPSDDIESIGDSESDFDELSESEVARYEAKRDRKQRRLDKELRALSREAQSHGLTDKSGSDPRASTSSTEQRLPVSSADEKEEGEASVAIGCVDVATPIGSQDEAVTHRLGGAMKSRHRRGRHKDDQFSAVGSTKSSSGDSGQRPSLVKPLPSPDVPGSPELFAPEEALRRSSPGKTSSVIDSFALPPRATPPLSPPTFKSASVVVSKFDQFLTRRRSPPQRPPELPRRMPNPTYLPAVSVGKWIVGTFAPPSPVSASNGKAPTPAQSMTVAAPAATLTNYATSASSLRRTARIGLPASTAHLQTWTAKPHKRKRSQRQLTGKHFAWLRRSAFNSDVVSLECDDEFGPDVDGCDDLDQDEGGILRGIVFVTKSWAHEGLDLGRRSAWNGGRGMVSMENEDGGESGEYGLRWAVADPWFEPGLVDADEHEVVWNGFDDDEDDDDDFGLVSSPPRIGKPPIVPFQTPTAVDRLHVITTAPSGSGSASTLAVKAPALVGLAGQLRDATLVDETDAEDNALSSIARLGP